MVAGQGDLIEKVAKQYAGRASSSQTLDVFMTLLSLGKNGYLKLIKEREAVFQHMNDTLMNLNDSSVSVIKTKNNPISIAIALNSYASEMNLGSMLFKRGISGARFVSTCEIKSIDGYTFKGKSQTSKLFFNAN